VAAGEGHAACKKLLQASQATIQQAQKVLPVLKEHSNQAAQKLAERLSTFLSKAKQVIDQTIWRVFQQEQVVATEKTVSILSRIPRSAGGPRPTNRPSTVARCRSSYGRLKLSLRFTPTAGASHPAVFFLNRMEKSDFSPFIPKYSLGATICGESTMKTLSDFTPPELEILRLVLAGYTNKAIAAEISIFEKSVEYHLDNIYTKIGVRTRVMAGIWALQQGILAETREIPS
jgi:DNA-binding CsgD family transcriptional regulator